VANTGKQYNAVPDPRCVILRHDNDSIILSAMEKANDRERYEACSTPSS
jgi:hypothetical protein